MSERLPLSVIIPAFNEEENLAACLDSVAFAENTPSP